MGGKATNSGVGFQQSCATHFLMHMLLEIPLGNIFLEDFVNEKILEVYIETPDKIDDIKVVSDEDKEIFIQVKNNLSSSMSEDNPLYEAFVQVVNQYQLKNQNDYFVICTSTGTTNLIRRFQEIFSIIRKNPTGYKKNNLNKQDKTNIANMEAMLKKISKTLDTKSITNILSRTYILIIDPGTKDYILLLEHMQSTTSYHMAQLLWNSLQQESIKSASEGSSFNKKALQNKFNQYLLQSKNEKLYHYLDNLNFSFERDCFIVQDKASREYRILVENKNSLDSKIKQNNLIRRFSTVQQAELYCKEEELDYTIIDNYKENIDNFSLMNEKAKIQLSECGVSKCIHCNESIDEKYVTIVEIDVLHTTNYIGLNVEVVGSIHVNCIRCEDRYLGQINISSFTNKIANIDIMEWEKLQKCDHGFLKNFERSPGYRQDCEVIINWAPFEKYTKDEKYCVQYTAVNEEITYEVYRQKLHRMTLEDAQEVIDDFYKNFTSTQYIKKADLVKFSNILAVKYNIYENFYTPLICFSSGETYLTINKLLVFVSNIFNIQEFQRNWMENTIDFSNFKPTLIRDDSEFDNIMLKNYYRENIEGAIIDPLLSDCNIIKGIKLVDMKNIHNLLS